MNLQELETYLGARFDLKMPDSAINGLQVSNDDSEKPIKKIITAVDASLETVEKAIKLGGEVLLVHHGIFWGKQFPITRRYYHLVKKFFTHNIALIGLHLPLDIDQKLGNNISLLQELGLRFEGVFGDYHGIPIIFKGSLEETIPFNDFVNIYREKFGEPLHTIESGDHPVQTVGVCSGGGLFGIDHSIGEKCDTYLTGDINHTAYHQVREEGIHLLSGGHYQTEVLGIKRLGKEVAEKFGVEEVFVDLPTQI